MAADDNTDGSLPRLLPPEAVGRYAALAPDFPAAYLRQWVAQAEHRREVAQAAAAARERTIHRAQRSLLLFALAVLVVGAMSLLGGLPWIALVIVGFDVAAVAWACYLISGVAAR